MSDLTLYIGNKNYSSWSLRPWLALKATGAPFKEVLIPFAQPDTRTRMLEVSSSGKVPVLKHGDLTIWDSLAICEYIAESFPHAMLWPDDREARATARALCAEMHSGFQAMRTSLNMNIRRRFTNFPVRADVVKDVDRILRLWSDARSKFPAPGPFLFGHFTIADAFFAPVVTRFVTYGVEVNIDARAYMDAILTLPAMRAWIEAAEAETLDDAAHEYVTV